MLGLRNLRARETSGSSSPISLEHLTITRIKELFAREMRTCIQQDGVRLPRMSLVEGTVLS
jgi:hypothetical protein